MGRAISCSSSAVVLGAGVEVGAAGHAGLGQLFEAALAAGVPEVAGSDTTNVAFGIDWLPIPNIVFKAAYRDYEDGGDRLEASLGDLNDTAALWVGAGARGAAPIGTAAEAEGEARWRAATPRIALEP